MFNNSLIARLILKSLVSEARLCDRQPCYTSFSVRVANRMYNCCIIGYKHFKKNGLNSVKLSSRRYIHHQLISILFISLPPSLILDVVFDHLLTEKCILIDLIYISFIIGEAEHLFVSFFFFFF